MDLPKLASPNSTSGPMQPEGSSLPSRAERDRGNVVDVPEFTSSAIERRRRQNREAKARQRLKEASLGDEVLEIRVTANEAALLESLRQLQRGPVMGFYRRALIVGARFLANAGTPRGRKCKGNSEAAAMRGDK